MAKPTVKTKSSTVKVKPIQAPLVYEIVGGNWTHVVVTKEINKAVAMFTSFDDAESYATHNWEYNDLEIREYQP